MLSLCYYSTCLVNEASQLYLFCLSLLSNWKELIKLALPVIFQPHCPLFAIVSCAWLQLNNVMGLLFIYQIGGRDLEVTVELSNSFSLSSSLTWSIWSKVTLGITYLWMWELVNHFIIFRSRQADQDHRPVCACKASHSSEFSSGISTEIIQCECTKIYSAVHEFTIVCKHAKVTSAVSRLD